MTTFGELVRYDGKHVVVTGCASGIGAQLAAQLTELGAHVIGLDRAAPDDWPGQFHPVDLADPNSVARVADSLRDPLDGLFNVAGVSSGIGDPELVVRINFLGTRALTEAVLPRLTAGAAVTNVASLAASSYRENASVTAGLVDTDSVASGLAWCAQHPEAMADGGYRLAKEAIILYSLNKVAELGARGIRINCSAPGVTETPILDQLRAAYGQQFLDSFEAPLGRASDAAEQAAVLVFLGSAAAGYVTGQVVWADGGILAQRWVAEQAPATNRQE